MRRALCARLSACAARARLRTAPCGAASGVCETAGAGADGHAVSYAHSKSGLDMLSGSGLNGFSLWSLVLAVIGALLLLWIYRMTTRSRAKLP